MCTLNLKTVPCGLTIGKRWKSREKKHIYGLGSIAMETAIFWIPFPTDAKLESFNVSCAFMSAVGWVRKIETTLGMMFPASFAVWDHPSMNEGKIAFARKFKIS